MRKDIKKLIIFSLLFSIGLTFWGRGSFSHFMIVAIPAFWLGGPLLFIAVGLLIFYMFSKKPGLKSSAIKCLLITLFLVIQLLSLVAGKWIYKYEIGEAKKYCETMIPILEQYKQEYGKYPKDIDELGIDRKTLPRVLKMNEDFYTSIKGDKININFSDHGGIFGIYFYDIEGDYWLID